MPSPSRFSPRLAVAAASLLAACSSQGDRPPLNPAAAFAGGTPAQHAMEVADPTVTTTISAAATKYADLAYATRSARQKLDLYIPSAGRGPFPVVLWIHGGGWQTGDKALASNAAQLSLTNGGFAIASVNYRLSGEAKYPAQIQDLKAAVRWLRANARRYNLDPSRVAAWGASAGGHLASLLGSSGGVVALADPTLGNPTQSDAVNAVVDFFGPVAFRALDSQLAAQGCEPFPHGGYASASSPPSKLLGAPINTVPLKVAQADPTSYTNTGDAAFLIQHGTGDCMVPYAQSTLLFNNVRKRVGSARVRLQLLTGYRHADPRFFSTANLSAVATFLKSHI